MPKFQADADDDYDDYEPEPTRWSDVLADLAMWGAVVWVSSELLRLRRAVNGLAEIVIPDGYPAWEPRRVSHEPDSERDQEAASEGAGAAGEGGEYDLPSGSLDGARAGEEDRSGSPSGAGTGDDD